MNHSDAVLNRLGITDYIEQKDEYLANCILCGEHKNNLQINFVKEVYHCWSCNAGGTIFKLVETITGLEKADAVRLFHLDEIDVEKTIRQAINIMASQKRRTYNYKRFHHNWDKIEKLWHKRGIMPATIDDFDLGFDSTTNRIVIPLIDDGACLGLVRRATLPDQLPKYLTTKGFDKSDYIFGWDLLDITLDYVVVTEGCIDAMVTRQLGLNSVAIMGVDLTRNNMERLADNFDRVMLMFDNDDAGEAATETIMKRLWHNGVETYYIEYDAEDPGSLTNINQVIAYVKFSLIG